jgi:hypothetical protein
MVATKGEATRADASTSVGAGADGAGSPAGVDASAAVPDADTGAKCAGADLFAGVLRTTVFACAGRFFAPGRTVDRAVAVFTGACTCRTVGAR